MTLASRGRTSEGRRDGRWRGVGPVTIALVDLEEDVRFVADVRGNPEDLAIGDPVVVGWDRVDDDLTLPIWELAR